MNKGMNGKIKNLLVVAIVVLSTIAMVASAIATGEITATRDISTQTVRPGETFTVTVMITANQDIYAPILDENPPSGWTVTPIENGGATFKESEIKWLWLEMLSAGTSKTVVYNITVPTDAEIGTYYVTGSISAYQVSPTDVGGESEVCVKTIIDVIPPTIASVELDKYMVSPGETINVTISASDNIGIVSVTAKSFNTTWNSDETSLSVTSGTEASGIWTEAITAPSTAGTYNISVVAKDAAGNTATNNTVLYKVSGGPTYVSGIISSDTTWTATGSPYIVTGNILVAEGVTLTIDPDAVVKFNTGKGLQIAGELIARGTEAEPIIFTSNQISPAPGDWVNILFTDSSVDAIYDENGDYLSGSIMQYCTVEYGGGSDIPAVKIADSSPFVDHCTIKDNDNSGIYINAASESLVITNNTIQNNSAVQGGGIITIFATVSISGNIITGNSAIEGGGILASQGDVTIISNAITGNSASSRGGGIDAGYYGGTTTIVNNIITNNSANSAGGGISTYHGTTSIINNTITNNSASGGGGIYASVMAI